MVSTVPIPPLRNNSGLEEGLAPPSRHQQNGSNRPCSRSDSIMPSSSPKTESLILPACLPRHQLRGFSYQGSQFSLSQCHSFVVDAVLIDSPARFLARASFCVALQVSAGLAGASLWRHVACALPHIQ